MHGRVCTSTTPTFSGRRASVMGSRTRDANIDHLRTDWAHSKERAPMPPRPAKSSRTTTWGSRIAQGCAAAQRVSASRSVHGYVLPLGGPVDLSLANTRAR